MKLNSNCKISRQYANSKKVSFDSTISSFCNFYFVSKFNIHSLYIHTSIICFEAGAIQINLTILFAFDQGVFDSKVKRLI